MRLRVLRAKDAGVSDDLSGPAPSQPGLGLPGTGSGLGAMDGSQEDVVILGGAESSAEFDVEAASRSVKDSEKKKPAKRMSAASRCSRRDGPWRFTYDEVIEGGEKAEIAYPDNLEFQFEIPPDMENFEAW